MAGQCRIEFRHCCSPNFLASSEDVQRGFSGLPRLKCFGNSRIRSRRRSFGLAESRRLSISVVRAQRNDKEQRRIEKVDEKSLESWTTSVRKANMASRIFMVAFVWISLFFGISVANNDMNGGRSGRRGPRK